MDRIEYMGNGSGVSSLIMNHAFISGLPFQIFGEIFSGLHKPSSLECTCVHDKLLSAFLNHKKCISRSSIYTVPNALKLGEFVTVPNSHDSAMGKEWQVLQSYHQTVEVRQGKAWNTSAWRTLM